MATPPHRVWITPLKWTVFAMVIAVGIFLRVYSLEAVKGEGFDERVYGVYVTYLAEYGVLSYPKMVGEYAEKLETSGIVILPPTRLGFILPALAWQKTFHSSPIESARAISCLASILTLFLAGIVAGRAGGWRAGFAVTAFMAFAPTQISIAHRAFIDGYFGLLVLCVLWGLWESLRNPRQEWLWLYGLALVVLVLTKENAAFVYLGILGILTANHWAKFGQLTRPLVIATVAAPLAGAFILTVCSGGISMVVEVFSKNVSMNYALPYAILQQDGPWFRYLADLIMVSPSIMILAIGGAFLRSQKGSFTLFLVVFILVSYLVMGNLRYGINLRFANMWDFPLRWLAAAPILLWVDKARSPKAGAWLYYVALANICALEYLNYLDLFVRSELYDPTSSNLMRALDMLK